LCSALVRVGRDELKALLARPPKEALLFVYLGVLATCLQFSRFAVEYRYRIPALPFIFWLIGWQLARLATQPARWGRRLHGWIWLGLVVLGVFCNLRMLTPRYAGRLLAMK